MTNEEWRVKAKLLYVRKALYEFEAYLNLRDIDLARHSQKCLGVAIDRLQNIEETITRRVAALTGNEDENDQ